MVWCAANAHAHVPAPSVAAGAHVSSVQQVMFAPGRGRNEHWQLPAAKDAVSVTVAVWPADIAASCAALLHSTSAAAAARHETSAATASAKKMKKNAQIFSPRAPRVRGAS